MDVWQSGTLHIQPWTTFPTLTRGGQSTTVLLPWRLYQILICKSRTSCSTVCTIFAQTKRSPQTACWRQPQYRSVGKAHDVHTGPIISILSARCRRACTVTGHVKTQEGSC
jgi:hypothetical protein